MRHLPAIPALVGILLLAGCGDEDGTVRSAAQEAPAPDPELGLDAKTGKRIVAVSEHANVGDRELLFFAYEGTPRLWGLKEVGKDVIAAPAWDDAKVVFGTLLAKPKGEQTWAVVAADGSLGAERWDEVAMLTTPRNHIALRQGARIIYRGFAMKPISSVVMSDTWPVNEMLSRAQTWTKEMLGNVGTEGNIRNVTWDIRGSFPFVEALPDDSGADLAPYCLTFAKASNLILQTYYYAQYPDTLVSYFGPYEKVARNIVSGYRCAIRFNKGGDKAVEKEARHGRVEATFVLLSYDRAPIGRDELQKLVAEVNEDLNWLADDEGEKQFVESFAPELQKLVQKRM